MYVNRETGLAPESPSEQQRRPSIRPGQGSGSGVAVVARPTASKEWRREPEHGRRRPAAGVTTPKQQRPVQQEKAATRHDHSRRRYVNDVRPATPPSHSTPLVSTATPVDGSTITRPSTNSGRHSRLSGDSHGRQFVSSSGSATRPSHSVGLTHRQLQRRLRWLLSFATGTAQLLELSSNHTISRFTLTGSQNYSDGPQHAAHSNISTQ